MKGEAADTEMLAAFLHQYPDKTHSSQEAKDLRRTKTAAKTQQRSDLNDSVRIDLYERMQPNKPLKTEHRNFDDESRKT